MPSNIFKTIEAEQTVFILFSVLPGVCWLIFWVLTNGFDVISASSDLHSSEDTEFEETSILKRYSHENRGCRSLNKLHSISTFSAFENKRVPRSGTITLTNLITRGIIMWSCHALQTTLLTFAHLYAPNLH